jgi:mono/diheme cytochrome c family protein
MGTSANPVGRWALLAALVITALMIVYYALGGDGQIAFGMAVISLITAGFIYLFYARMNTVQRTGTMALIFMILVAIMLPFFFLATAKVAADRTKAQYDNQLSYAAGLFTTYCQQCHGLLGQGLAGPQLNNRLSYKPNGNPALSQLTAIDINRIITAGVPDPTDLKNYMMPQWGQAYGGPLNTDDVSALTALVVSADSTLQTKEGVPDTTNGFDFVPNYLTTPALQQMYQQQLFALQHPTGPEIDLTSMSAVTITVINVPSTVYGFIYTDKTGNQYTSIKIKAGTKITWVNQTSVTHSVTSGTSATGDAHVWTSDDTLGPGQTFSVTVTQTGKINYYCKYHSGMVGLLDVVP